MAGMESITAQLRQLALQHSKDSEHSPSDQTRETDTDTDQLISKIMARLIPTDASSPSSSEDIDSATDTDSDGLEVDSSHTFDDLSKFALQLNDAALSTHLLPVNMRNWFQQRSLPEHYHVAKKMTHALSLRRLEAAVIESQAADPNANTSEEKKRLRRLFVEAEGSPSSLGAIEIDLIEVFNIGQAGNEGSGWSNDDWQDILEELVGIQEREESKSGYPGWTLLHGVGS